MSLSTDRPTDAAAEPTHQPRERYVPCTYCARLTGNVHAVCSRCSPPSLHPRGGQRECCADDTPTQVWPELLIEADPQWSDDGTPLWMAKAS